MTLPLPRFLGAGWSPGARWSLGARWLLGAGWRRTALTAVAASATLTAACDPDVSVITRPRPGEEYLRDYVAIGDGFTAGVQSGALAKRLQVDSVPALLGISFATPTDPFVEVIQPFIALPGYPLPRPAPYGYLELRDLSPLVIEPAPWDDPSLVNDRREMHVTMELNRENPLPFRNLGIPGALAWDVLHAVDSLSSFAGRFAGEPNYFFDVVLRPGEILSAPGEALTVTEQALRLTPGLATVWLGTSEILAGAAAGDPALVPYDAATFASYLDTLVVTLQDSTATRVTIANVPSPGTMPFFRALPWYVTDDEGRPVPHPEHAGVVALLGEGTEASDLQPGVTIVAEASTVLLPARSLIATGYGVPNEILIRRIAADQGVSEGEAALLMGSLYPNHGRPLPASATLTPDEMTAIETTVDAYNAAIAQVAIARDAPLLDVNALFEVFATTGVDVGSVHLGADYVTGGIFGLDGIYPSSFGYALIADAWVDVINAGFGAAAGPVDLGSLLNPPPISLEP